MERYFFVESGNYKVGDQIKIEGIEHNHISKVLRSKVGDKIVCLPNDGTLLFCQIVSFSKLATTVKIDRVEQSESETKTSLTVFVPLLKSDKFEFLITKLTELGVKKIVPFESQFMTAKPTKNDKTERYTQIAKDACKQCRRAKLIEIENLISFDEMLNQIKNYDYAFFAYENERTQKLSSFNLQSSTVEGCLHKNIAMIVGSEGGFSTQEAEKIVNANAKIISLGNRILRAETACLALASILQYKLNEI